MTFMTSTTNIPEKRPFGAWKSPIIATQLTQSSVRLSQVELDLVNDLAQKKALYWLESRPQEKGRSVLVRKNLSSDAPAEDVLPAPWSIRSRCHEYGGNSFAIHNGQLYFVEASSQRLYHFDTQNPESAPRPLTSAINWRFADLCIDLTRKQLIALREDHTVVDNGERKEERNEIVAVPLDGSAENDPSAMTILASGCDFYSNPRISPNGEQLSWLCWNHPHMPWDNTVIVIANIQSDGSLTTTETIGDLDHGNESRFQPQWSPEGDLLFMSDKNNWWQPYRWHQGADSSVVAPVLESAVSSTTAENLEAEFATPQWVFGMSTYGFVSPHSLICTYTQKGRWQLGAIDIKTGELEALDTPFCSISGITADASTGACAFLAASETAFETVYFLDSPTATPQLIAHSNAATVDQDYLSIPEPIQFTSTDDRIAFGFYYSPKNSEFTGSDQEKPPLIVMGHGGPTGATEAGLNLKVQYWTSRGFAVLDVNYAGSTGYGRTFRDSLKPHWGVRDVEDLCAGAEHLVKEGKADPERLITRGSSAGGYSVLSALTFKNTFKAGCSLYGIADLEALLRDTHKFEARYFDSLIGPYPEKAETYKARSPINHIDGLSCPVIFFQGMDDKVVPPNQAEAMVSAMKEKGIPVAYIPFEGEGHGFRQASTIERSLEAELSFYGQIFGFEPAGDITPVEIA